MSKKKKKKKKKKIKKRILVITGGPVKKLDHFKLRSRQLGLNVDFASFYDLSYILKTQSKKYKLLVSGKDVKKYDLIYIRMVGKRLEDATLLVNYAKEHGVRVVDKVYLKSLGMPSTVSKAMEMHKLSSAGIRTPKTYYASLKKIMENAEKKLDFPFVIKATVGRKARNVWAPEKKKELKKLFEELRKKEIKGMNFFAQKMIPSVKRIRILVVGNHALGGVVRSTKFRKRFQKKVKGQYPDPVKITLNVVPRELEDISVKAAKACGLEVAGVDILVGREKEKMYVIEANAAPAWRLIKKYTKVDVEGEILKYLKGLKVKQKPEKKKKKTIT
jgi:ribosomal protein S6--L-glutamate ligase